MRASRFTPKFSKPLVEFKIYFSKYLKRKSVRLVCFDGGLDHTLVLWNGGEVVQLYAEQRG
jgi:hypothetical protein